MTQPKAPVVGMIILFGLAACGPGDEGSPVQGGEASGTRDDPVPSSHDETRTDADAKDYETPAFPDVTRTLTGNGGIVALAGELSIEFDYAPAGGRCTTDEGRFSAKGAEVGDTGRRVMIEYAEVVDPNTGRSLGPALNLEIRAGDDRMWAAHVGSGIAGKVEDIVQQATAGGGSTLMVTGVAASFRYNGMPTGSSAPFRLLALCE